jgi:hypothetical protein
METFSPSTKKLAHFHASIGTTFLRTIPRFLLSIIERILRQLQASTCCDVLYEANQLFHKSRDKPRGETQLTYNRYQASSMRQVPGDQIIRACAKFNLLVYQQTF